MDYRHAPPRTPGVIVVCGQKIAIGRARGGQTLAIGFLRHPISMIVMPGLASAGPGW